MPVARHSYLKRDLATQPTLMILSLKPLPLSPFRPCTRSRILISPRETILGGLFVMKELAMIPTTLMIASLAFFRIHIMRFAACVHPGFCIWCRARLALPLLTFLPVPFHSQEHWTYDLQVGFCLVTCEI